MRQMVGNKIETMFANFTDDERIAEVVREYLASSNICIMSFPMSCKELLRRRVPSEYGENLT